MRPIHSLDIRAMKEARDVYAVVRDGKGYLHCLGPTPRGDSLFLNDGSAPFRDIPTEYHVRSASKSAVPDSATAFEHVGGRYSDTWQTAVALMKPGDTLTLDFVADGIGGGRGDNGYLSMASIQETDCRAAHDAREQRRRDSATEDYPYVPDIYYSHATPATGLHGDACYLAISRTSGRTHKTSTHVVLLSVSITPNNSARMIGR